MTGRIIAIGDIHGCHQEFSDLLALLNLAKDDRLILLGDLVNRGPDSCKVIDLARQHHATALLGNHELRLLAYHKTKDPSHLRETDIGTFSKLRPADWEYIGQMPLTHHEETLNTVFVHGGFLPGIPWQKQSAETVTNIQVIDSGGRPRKRADAPNAPFWADLWSGPPFVVYGHTPRPETYKLKWSLGIDTACVMGGALTAYILPEKRIVQVKARKKYFP
ncbi:serine/threonine protein phosphatase 1 [Ereboglobus sp. PH5-10]|uniref:metallophosphoesterase n=1 Tax=Ereboglobus sp. PH5-10 TaxID=2940629 RepID=UPI0024074499|nr:metallophosphoesterase [Ereboglobus sp. PH5-10]MDF9827880.1 serine/threonine protein phosphatase 1 [Ereboglobus sp. PH5-10]